MTRQTVTQTQQQAPTTHLLSQGGILQRMCRSCGQHEIGDGKCRECQKKQVFNDRIVPVQRSSLQESKGLSSIDRINTSGGNSLPDESRQLMENHFHTDFSSVRVHTDTASGNIALNMGAKAFATGQNIYFAPGYFQPSSSQGLKLLAHELTHVIQQRNGRVSLPAASNNVNQMNSLENEAQSAEQSILNQGASIQVQQRTASSAIQQSPLDDFREIRNAAARGINALVDFVVLKASGTDSLITKLNTMRLTIQNRTQAVVLPSTTVAEMANVYQGLRAYAPSWLPLPDIRFISTVQPNPLIIIGGVAITLEALILFVAFLIVMLYYLGLSDPKTRKRQDQEIEQLLEKITEGIRRPTAPLPPKPEKEPEQKPKETGPTIGPRPDIDNPDEETDRRGCTTVSIAMQYGKYLCHADFAKLFSGVRREFLVTTPERASKTFDARDLTGRLYEVKTGYEFVLNPNLPSLWRKRKQEVIEEFQAQAQDQLAVANRCNRQLVWYFNNKRVAEFFDPLIEPPVKAQEFNCDKDSDHMW